MAERKFFASRWESLRKAVDRAPNHEKVRGFLAFVLVGVLIALEFNAPSDRTTLVSSAKTLAIAVVAFYFGLHKETPGRRRRTRGQDRARPPEQA